MTERKPELNLSRRKLLAGMGAIGVASAGAGLGTTAYFSDTEAFTNNGLTAGQLDAKAKWQVKYYGASEELETHVESTSEDATDLACDADFDRPQIDLQDVKPGDSVLVRFDLLSCTNPGYLWMNGGVTANNEGEGMTEPEMKDPDEPGPASPLGELDQVMQTQIYVRPSFGESDFASVEELVGYGGTAQDENSTPVFPVGGVTLAQAMSTLSMGLGLPLSGDVESTGNRNCFAGSTTQSVSAHQIAMEIAMPVDHGNEAQGDVFSMDVGFYGEQCRHNDGTGMPAEGATPAIEAADSTAGATTTHGIRIPTAAIEGFASGPLDSVTITYPPGEGFDVTAVSSADGVLEKAGGGTVSLTPTVNPLDSNTLELDYDGSATLEAGDAIVALVDTVTNASSPGTYAVDFAVNGGPAGTADLEIT